MTTIRMLGKHGDYFGFEVSGHTGAGTEGNDLVCAAVSFLTVTIVNAMETVAKSPMKVRQADGYIKAELKTEHRNEQAQTILNTFHQGAKDLHQEYPAFVTLIEPMI